MREEDGPVVLAMVTALDQQSPCPGLSDAEEKQVRGGCGLALEQLHWELRPEAGSGTGGWTSASAGHPAGGRNWSDMAGSTQHCSCPGVSALLLNSQWGFSSDQHPVLLFHIVAHNSYTSGGQKEYSTPKYLCVVLLDVPAQVMDGPPGVGAMDHIQGAAEGTPRG